MAEPIIHGFGDPLPDLPIEEISDDRPTPKKLNGANGHHYDKPTEKIPRIIEAYPYLGVDGDVIYRVCRLEDGRRTTQRPVPGYPGAWAWGFNPGEYVRRWDGVDFFVARDSRTPSNGWTISTRIEEEISHGLFNFPEIREEMLQDDDDRRTVWFCKNEQECLALGEWDCLATTNSGGLKQWRPDLAEHFRGASVVLSVSNDRNSRERADELAKSLRSIAKRVRLFDIKSVWAQCPDKADILEWRDRGGGTGVKLVAALSALKDWTPEPYKSKFGRLSFADLDKPGLEFEYIIDEFFSVGDKSIIGGPSLSGKSFLAIHAAMAMNQGTEFFGRQVFKTGLVVYQAGEGARGIKKRLRAYREHFGIGKGKKVPFELLQSRVDIYSPEGDTASLIEEINAIAAEYEEPLVAVFIDTLATAMGGAEENSGKDMFMVMDNIDKIRTATGAHVCLVHHLNAAGTKLRGHTSVFANVDQVVMVTRDETTKIRTAVLGKQKDDEDGISIQFELMQVETGRVRVADGRAETSCVCLQVGEKATLQKRYFSPRPQEAKIFRAFLDAVAKYGVLPANDVPSNGEKTITYPEWKECYTALDLYDDEETSKLDARVRKAMERAGDSLVNKFHIIDKFERDKKNKVFWWSGKPVKGFECTYPKTREKVQRPYTETDGEILEF